MKIIKHILYIGGVCALLLVSGLMIYLFAVGFNQWRIRQADIYYTEFESSGNTDSLLQAAVLNPDQGNLSDTIDVLLDYGDYQTADALRLLSNEADYSTRAAEASLLNLDSDQANKYLREVTSTEIRNELLIFERWTQGTETTEKSPEPKTEVGKLMTMITKNDFSLYTISGILGKNITDINKEYPQQKQNTLRQAENLSNHRLYYPALALLEDFTDSCNTDYFLIKANIYEKLNNQKLSISIIKEGLVCDPSDMNLLEGITRIYTSMGDDVHANYYRDRIKYLSKFSY